jgi:predicted DNA-binding transcriptional regulator AlpA
MSLSADTSTTTAIPRRRDVSLYGQGPDDRLIPLREVLALLGCGRTSAYALIKLGKLSKPVKSGVGDSSRWVLGEIRQFVRDAIAARGAPKHPLVAARQ